MIKRLIQEYKDYKSHEEHMKYNPIETDNPEDNFNELIKLSERTNSKFKVYGEFDNFTISIESYTIFIVLFDLLLLAIPFFISDNYVSFYFWFFESILLFVIYLGFKEGPTTYDFEFNSITKIITIKSNSFVGKYIKPVIRIDYKDFVRISGERIQVTHQLKGVRQTFYGTDIYMQYDKTSIDIVKLPNGPFYYINSNIFIHCLNKIIEFYKR